MTLFVRQPLSPFVRSMAQNICFASEFRCDLTNEVTYAMKKARRNGAAMEKRMIELYSGAGAYVLLHSDGWIFAHEVLPDPWLRTSGSGLTVTLRPWAKLPVGAIWVPTVRAIGNPWRYNATGPDPASLPRNEAGEPLALAGPVRCKWHRAQFEFRLLVGTAAIEAAQESIRANSFARMLLEGQNPVAIAAHDARIAVASLDWEARWHNEEWILVAHTEGGRWLAAADGWVAAAATEDEAISLALRAEDEFKATAAPDTDY
jgi:hypothetical protein